MKITVKFTENPRAYGIHGDAALVDEEFHFVVPTNDIQRGIEWVKNSPNFVPDGRHVQFFVNGALIDV